MTQFLNQYYVFYITAQCGNISNAAKRLYISQPAVSKAISKLEEGLGTELFCRNSRGVALTEAGELLYHQLETAFRAIEAGEEQLLHREALGTGRLSIGASSTLCKYVLLPYLKSYRKENPHVRISISCQSTHETIAALDAGILDVGLIGETDRLGSLSFCPVRTISDVFVTTREYLGALKERSAATTDINACQDSSIMDASAIEELSAQTTLLTLDKNNVSRQYVDKYMILHNIRFGQQLEVTTMDLLIDFAKIGLGIACVIEDFVKKELEEGSLVIFPTKEPIPPRKIGIAYSRHSLTNPAARQFIEGVLAPS